VSAREGADPAASACPACEEPLFVWVETIGWGPREDEVIDRCENCGLVVSRAAARRAERIATELFDRLAAGERVRSANAASLQAWLGAENWAALRPQDPGLRLTPAAARLLAERREMKLRSIRQPPAQGMAAMWQTLLNLITFHRDFAAEAVSGRLRPSGGRGRAAFAVDAVITVLAAVPTAALAVLLEGGALIARRGGVIELAADQAGEPAG